jgi:hypothetical protein
MYFISGLSSGALRNGRFGELVVGDRQVEAVAEARSESSPIFFCWCVMFCASPASPMP